MLLILSSSANVQTRSTQSEPTGVNLLPSVGETLEAHEHLMRTRSELGPIFYLPLHGPFHVSHELDCRRNKGEYPVECMVRSLTRNLPREEEP